MEPTSKGPPPLPPMAPPPYVGVASGPPAPTTGTDEAQRVFDTIAGPNVRLRDNLIQLGCVVAGAVIGAVVGRFIPVRDAPPAAMSLAGAVVGVVAALLLSGLVIGVVRGVQGWRRRRQGGG